MADRGGMRVGAGRPAGSKNKATADIKEGLSGLAKNYTVEALGFFLVTKKAESETAIIDLLNPQFFVD